MKKKLVSIMSALIIGLSVAPVSTAMASQTDAPDYKLEEVKTTPVEQAEAEKVITAAAKNLVKAESFEAILDAEMVTQGMTAKVSGDAIVDLKNEKIGSNLTAMGQKLSAYIVDGTAYIKTGENWVKNKLPEDVFSKIKTETDKEIKVEPKYLELFEVGVAEDGSYVIKSKEPVTMDSLKEIVPKGTFNEKDLEDMSKTNFKMDMMMIIDKDNNYKKISVVGNVTEEKNESYFKVNIEFGNFNSAKEVVLPEDAK